MLKSKFAKLRVLFTSLMMVLVMSAVAFAEPVVGTANAAVSGAMEQASADIVATISSIAPYAITIFVIFLVWRYGKRIFKTVANG